MALELPYYAIASDGSISFLSGGTLAQRGEPGQPNRLYIVFEPTGNYFSRDTGATWENVGSSEEAASILEKLLTVDDDGSGLNANFLQGKAAAEFLLKAGGTMTAALVLAGDPTTALHAASKQYVDAVRTYVDSMLSGLDAKPDVRLASNTNHALTGPQTVDGVAVVTGDRILLKNQTAGAENGIWVANTTGAWTRATDADTAAKIKDMYTFVAGGAVEGNRDTGWLLTTDAITIGTTALVYGQFSGPGSTLAGTGLTRVGNTISASFGAVAGTVTEGNDARLKTIRDEGVALPNRPILDLLGNGIIAEDDAANGRTKVTISGAAAGAASEAASGVVELNTPAETIEGTDTTRAVHAAGLKAELDRRIPVATNAYLEVRRTNTQGLLNNTLVTLGFDAVDRDPRAWRQTPSSHVVDATGLYLLSADGSFDSSNTGVRLTQFKVAGVARGAQRFPAGFGSDFSNTTQAWLMAGDAVSLEILQSSGGTINLTAGCRMVISRLR